MKIKKVLIIRNGAIGDVIHTTGLFRAIKKAYPNILIDYATSYVTAPLLKNDPDLNEVFIFENYTYSYFLSLTKKIKNKDYDLIINLQPQLKFNLLCRLSGIKTVTYKKDFKEHAVENFFNTAKKMLPAIELDSDLKIFIQEKAKQYVKQVFPKIEEKKNVVFNMSATPQRQGRKWPVDYYKELAIRLINEYDCNILLTGSKDDKELTSQLKDLHKNIYDFSGEFTLIESAALYSMCDLFVSGDTGPLHIASATEKPVCIGLYGAMPIERTGVWGQSHFCISAKSKTPCVPCNKRICKYKNSQYNPCLENLKPEIVFSLIKEENLL